METTTTNRPTKPTMNKPVIENLPAAAILTASFCNWIYSWKDGRWTKLPLNPNTGKAAESNNRDTFGTLDEAIEAMKSDNDKGLGVGVFDDLCAIDIDNCVDESGGLSPMAQDIMNTIASYTEYSPSGRGIRILFTARNFRFDKAKHYTLNNGKGKTGCKLDLFNGVQQQLEVYVAGATHKYVTVTGNTLTPDYDMQERADEVQTILDKYMLKNTGKAAEPAKAATPGASSTREDGGYFLGTWEETVHKAKQRDSRFRYLYDLEPGQPGRDDSADDLSLANMLGVRLNGNRADMREALIASARGRRDKLKREDYLEGLLNKGLEAWAASERKREDRLEALKQKETARIKAAREAAEDDLERSANDNTDAGNALLYADMFRGQLCYVSEWGWTAWNGKHWETKAQEKSKYMFLKMCDTMKRDALEAMNLIPNDAQHQDARKAAESRYQWAIRSRNASKIKDGLNVAQALMVKDAAQFDSNAFDLNTPGGIVDLRTGKIRAHDPKAYCTSMTKYAPTAGAHPMWDEFLRYITADDQDLMDYLQIVAGMAAIGQVYYEGLVIAHGTGGNGKSTLFNAIQGVFGSYATSIRPQILMAMKNQSEVTGLIDVKGKRFVLAAETEEGSRLSESTMKRLASTDTISARWLYHDAITFTPSHTLVLCTNHLPKVGSTDHGTWRRIMTVPFIKRVEQDKPVIRNYSQVLQDKEGGCITAWIIEGAVKFITQGFDIGKLPQAVIDASAEYQAAENWISNFITECCDKGAKYSESGGTLYTTYQQWAEANGEYKRRGSDFAAALESCGYSKRVTMQGRVWDGIRISQRHKDLQAGFTRVNGPVIFNEQ